MTHRAKVSSKHICIIVMQILPSFIPLKFLLVILCVILCNLFIHSLRTPANSLSLQRLVKYVMNKSVTSNSELTFCFDCCRILYPWQLFTTQNRLKKWSVYLNSCADGSDCFFSERATVTGTVSFPDQLVFPTQQVMNSQRAHCGQLNIQLTSPI